MAEVLFANLVDQKKEAGVDWRIASAGCWAISGLPATANAISAMQARGLDLKWHRSQPVTESLLEEFNLILCMEHDHKQTLRKNFPDQAEKVFLLSEMVDGSQEINDPVGLPSDVYQSTVQLILYNLREGFDRILQLTD